MNTQIYLSVHTMVCPRLLNVCTYLQTTVNSHCISLLSGNASRGQGLGAPTYPPVWSWILPGRTAREVLLSALAQIKFWSLTAWLRRGLRSGDTVLERVCWRLQLRRGHRSFGEVPSSAFLLQFLSSTYSTKLYLMTIKFGGEQRDDRLLLFAQFVSNLEAGWDTC